MKRWTAWIPRRREIIEAELIEEPGTELATMEIDNQRRELPSSVVVMSEDGVTWAKEWGAQPIHFVQEFWIAYNINRVTFGPMKPGWSSRIGYFDVLDRQGVPMFGWQAVNRRLLTVPGDTFEFAPGALLITMTFGPARRDEAPRTSLEQMYRELER